MRILLTGGSACGKSTYAEQLACSLPQPRYYLATMRAYGAESQAKIKRHQQMRRDKGFLSLERDVHVGAVKVDPKATVLLECLCNLTANELFDDQNGTDDGAYQRIATDILSLEARCANLIVVTNDVGSGSPGSYSETTRLYVEVLGRLNGELAKRFDQVYELICGIPICLKGGVCQ
jgi:adenosylcobinamide kinase/adenosylcobinamide-phosphate guanylyltransferase